MKNCGWQICLLVRHPQSTNLEGSLEPSPARRFRGTSSVSQLRKRVVCRRLFCSWHTQKTYLIANCIIRGSPADSPLFPLMSLWIFPNVPVLFSAFTHVPLVHTPGLFGFM